MKYFPKTLIVLIALNCIILTTKAQIEFTRHIINDHTSGAGCIQTCDIDKDGDNDIIVAGLQDNQIILFKNNGGYPVSWQKVVIASNVGSAHSVHVADLNRDGNLDIVGAAYTGSPGVAWWQNDGNNPISWTKHTISNSFINAHEVHTCDIDGDGDVDVLGASSDLNKITLWYRANTIETHWIEQTIRTNYTLAKSVHAGDMDNDGDMDIIGASIIDNDVTWWRNDGGEPINWTEVVIDNNFYGAHKVQATDVDNDGDTDLVGAAYLGNSVAWWRNDGGSPIQWTKQTLSYGVTTACVAYAFDIDGDGDQEIVASSQGGNSIYLWINEGGTPVSWTRIVVDNDFTRVWPVQANDMDGDGDIDIVAATSHDGNREVRWYENMTIVGTEEDNNGDELGMDYHLFNNYPNPFNPSTLIKYNLREPQNVTLKVYDTLGNELTTLQNGFQNSGIYTVEWNAGKYTSGVYICSLQIGNKFITKKMMLMK